MKIEFHQETVKRTIAVSEVDILRVCLLPFLSLSLSFSLSGVVSVGFEEDEEGNLCLIAYPLHSDSGVGHLENIDLTVNGEPYSKMLHWGNKQLSARSLLDSHEDKDMR